jgi:succinate-semialdehyde dehydrogenase
MKMNVQHGELSGARAINPATGESQEHFPWFDSEKRDRVIAGAVAGYAIWRQIAVADRAQLFLRIAAYLRDHSPRFARTMSEEMGKPIKQARAEVEKCANLCDWYAANGTNLLDDEPTSVEGEKAYVSYLPLGVVLGIMPWNFPLWQVIRAAVPVLLAGNAFLLKHAPNCVRTAYNLDEAFTACGAPAGLFSVFNAHHDVIAGTIADKRIAGVSLTGSVRAGAAVAAEAGRNVKKSVLELGGSDAFIVFADADLAQAVPAAVEARFQNSGQICIAAKRIIVESAIVDEFTGKFIEAVRRLKIGDPLSEDTDIGPMARADLREELDAQVQRTIAAGATLALGGEKIGDEAACYYVPTILTGVRPGMAAFQEETFGPVAAIIIAKDAEDAIALANDSDFGLSGALWTRDVDRAKAIARRLETGGVFINGFAASDPRTPIGGIKRSGYGRELSHFGVREFTNPQIVWVDRR